MAKPVVIGRSDSFYRMPVYIDSRLPKADQMEVLRDVVVELRDCRRLVIKARFITDCHSTPAWSWSLLPAYDNRTNLAAIGHDFLYMCWEEFVTVYPELEPEGRAYADAVYFELMERFKPGGLKNRVYFAGVRLFGGWNWRKFRRKARSL